MSDTSSLKIHPSAVVDEGSIIGDDTTIWHFSHVCAGAVIGKNCSLGQNVLVADIATLGNNVKVQNNVAIYGGITVEDDVFLGMGLLLCSGNRMHNFCAAPTEAGRKKDVMHAYINHIIKTHANSSWILDFEGSELDSVAYFFGKFNPVEEHYLHVKTYPILGL